MDPLKYTLDLVLSKPRRKRDRALIIDDQAKSWIKVILGLLNNGDTRVRCDNSYQRLWCYFVGHALGLTRESG